MLCTYLGQRIGDMKFESDSRRWQVAYNEWRSRIRVCFKWTLRTSEPEICSEVVTVAAYHAQERGVPRPRHIFLWIKLHQAALAAERAMLSTIQEALQDGG